MSKVIILGGNARSGKTTLSKKLREKGFNHISFDELYDFMKEGLNINVDEMTHEEKMQLFEYIFKKILQREDSERYVLDVYDFLPSDLSKYKGLDNVEIYFLAYPGCSKDEIKFNVIHYAAPSDWIAQVNEEYLNECVDRFDRRNKILIKECEEYGMNLIDTKSGDDRDIILNDLFKEITAGKSRK